MNATTTMTTNMHSPSLALATNTNPTTTPSPTAQTIHPAERHDIHKSCRTIEVLVGALTDYCEAASTLASVQKKVAKALKDAAGIKGGVEYAANALSATATIFEVLAEVDGKFAKIAVKECTSMSAEVKKWFKKLAKEEKAHDERMSESNAKIKQAGQLYEKKSKKGTRDASEEHARYIQLLSVVGPEMSQSKHNHAVFVAQRHASTVFCVAGCLSRIADAEWVRTCESMRRFAPTIGPLGEWRALCEGAWTGPLPDDLPEAPDMLSTHGHNVSPNQTMTTAVGCTISPSVVSEWGFTGMPPQRSLPIPPGGAFTPSSVPLDLPHLPYASNTHSSTNSRTSATTNDSLNSNENQGSIHSVTTLSAFPLPPTHIPVPAVVSATPITKAEVLRQQHEAHQVQRMQLQNIQAALSHMEIQNRAQSPAQCRQNPPPLSESPQATEILLSAGPAHGMPDPPKSPRIPSPLLQTPSVSPRSDSFTEGRPGSSSGHKVMASPKGGEPRRLRRHSIVRPPLPSPAPTAPLPPPPPLATPSPTLAFRPVSPFKRVEQVGREFGVNNEGLDKGTRSGCVIGSDSGRSSRNVFKSQSVDAGRKPLDRSDSTGSSVAALRNRYSRIIDSPAQGPKDIPRLPMSVFEIASKYQPIDEPMSPRRMAVSPSTDRFPPFPETPSRQGTRDLQIDENEIRRRKQRIEDLAELELKEKEFELRQRERELDQRSRELERDRLHFLSARPTSSGGISGEVPRGPRNSPFLHKRGSQSVSHIVLPKPPPSSVIATNMVAAATGSTSQLPLRMPMPKSLPSPVSRGSPSPSRSQSSTPLPAKDHAPFCGCDTCSASKYRLPNVPPSPRDLRPPEPPIMLRPERPKGWIRRLSMPSVSGALSLDAAKKNAASLASLTQGLSIPVGENGRLRKRSFEQDIVGVGRG
ncbi:hypothetical protein V8B97DRAFT_332494 [Scleroderma yunnanense]